MAPVKGQDGFAHIHELTTTSLSYYIKMQSETGG